MNYKSISKLFMLGFILAFMFSSCTKEGPMGLPGADGTDGTDGADGMDGNQTCLVCHTQSNMDAITAAFTEHPHAAGTSFAYAGTRTGCAQCHSDEGYVTYITTGAEIAPAVGAPLECSTCHNNHRSLEEGISAPLYSIEEVASAAIDGKTYNFEASNLCASCHQARSTPASYYPSDAETYTRTFTGDDIVAYQAHGAVGPNGSKTLNATEDTLTVVFDVPLTHVYTSSTHAGPHHGPQANMIAADMGSQIGTPFEQAHHTCINCHMHGEDGASGHSYVADLDMCNNCHGDAVDIEGIQTDIATRMAAVEAALEDLGAIHVAEDGVHPMYASLPKDQWDAFFNYMCLWEDKSHGAHNPGYARQLLNQAEAALGL
nr:cytochrome c3 family protein [uncultured Draconibacterium sp.]